MDPERLSSRIREILGNRPKNILPAAPVTVPGAADEEHAFARRCAEAEARTSVLEVLGGRLLDGGRGPVIVVERDYLPDHRHGAARVGGLAANVAQAASGLELLRRGREAMSPSLLDDEAPGGPPDLLFFDLETTGLSGGAGTYAFLVGCGSFDADGAFQTVQFFLRSYSEERALLDAVGAFVEHRGLCGGLRRGRPDMTSEPVLVTYNGKAFDVPLIETRYLMHRLTSPFNEAPHIDMLHPARRLWRRRVTSAVPLDDGWPPPLPETGRGRRRPDLAASCALTTLERDILGLSRDDDVAGFEIPARYFHFARTGDARGLAAVFEHNRLDLLSLAAVTSVVLGMIEEGPAATRAAEECLELGRLYEMAGRVQEATACYEHVAERPAGDGEHERGWVRVESLRRLALRLHRERRHPEAASTWQRLLTLDPDPVTEREACEALAIYNEHRSRDLPAAKNYALQALSGEDDTRRAAELRHRLERLDRKMQRPWGQV